ncbi:hypothetical protein [Paenibacillus sp. LjRoot56]|uniref:hypothetical protein n=1 Tax=Paenibacillus sp. LjRoot56 TaxID=3342333 RepID=UPI003ECFAD9A
MQSSWWGGSVADAELVTGWKCGRWRARGRDGGWWMVDGERASQSKKKPPRKATGFFFIILKSAVPQAGTP